MAEIFVSLASRLLIPPACWFIAINPGRSLLLYAYKPWSLNLLVFACSNPG